MLGLVARLGLVRVRVMIKVRVKETIIANTTQNRQIRRPLPRMLIGKKLRSPIVIVWLSSTRVSARWREAT